MWPLAIDAAWRGPAAAGWLRRWLAWWWALGLGLALGLTPPAQAGTYRADTSAGNATLYPWIDSTSGTTLNLGDNGLSATIAIGFNFTLGTTSYANLRIDANGTVQFGGTVTTNVTYALPLNGAGGKPNVDAILMPLWDDLYPDSGDISYKLTGTSPNRVFTITWTSSQYRCSYYILNSLTCYLWGQTGWASDSATFQVQLHENGTIVYRYGDVQGNGGAHWNGDFTNGGATIGIEVNDSNYTQFSRDTASISNGTTIVWTQYIPTLVSGQRYSFESYDVAGSYIRQFSPLASISALTSASSLSSRQDASFIVRPGLADSSCWSFESVSNPGYYLRHSSFRLRLDIYSASGTYLADATFCERAGLSGSGTESFESVNYAGYYIRHLADLTVGIGANDGTGTYNDRATWTAGTALSEAVRLVAQWDMESISTNTTPDSSGNGNTLSLGATATLTNGTAGYGLGLAGASPAAGSSTGATLPSTGSYTVSAWVRFNSLTACQAQAVVSQDGTTVHPFAITMVPGCGLPQSLYFEIMATDSDGSAVKRVYALASPAANTWLHVAGVYNAATSTMSFYVNCTLQGTQTSVSTFSGSGPFTVGRSRFSAGQRDFLNGVVDGVKVWTGVRTATEIATECTNMPRRLIAEYRFDESAWTASAGAVTDQSGNAYHATAAGLSSTWPNTATTSPVVSASPGTCSFGRFTRSNKQYVALPAGLPRLGGSSGFTVTAWFRTTDRTQSGQRIFIDDEGGGGFIISLGDRGAGMVNAYSRTSNTGSELVTGAVVSNNTWYFMAFTVDMSTKTKRLYVYDTAGSQLAASSLTFTASVFNTSTGIASIGGETNGAGVEANSNYGFSGDIDEVRVYENALSTTELDAVRNLTRICASYGPDHLQLEHDGSALTCTPETVTVKACANTACSSLYTSGTVTGSVSWSGAASGSTAFTIASGSASTTVSVPVTSIGSVTLATSGVSPSTSASTTCLNTSTSAASCALAFAEAGWLFSVPNHRAETAQTVSLTAVRKSDNAAGCSPAFQNVSRTVTFTCGYTNPGTGTLPVRVNNTALNAGNSTSAACDGSGRSLSLSFDGSGATSLDVRYADAGQVTLNASYTGSAGTSDAGLAMTGSSSFTAAPDHYTITGVSAGPIRAGVSFSATVTARNALGNTTANYGRESTPHTANIDLVPLQPTGSGAVKGSFSGGGSRSFTNGAVTVSNLSWTEVGRADLVARDSNSSGYLGTGLYLVGSSAGSGARDCAGQYGNCVLPGGANASVYYGAAGGYNIATGQSGTLGCSNTVFGDPLPGDGTKRCFYVTGASASGSVGDFIPNHFTVTATAACGSFTYGGQPFSATVTARNAAGNITQNFNGNSATTTPVFAQAVTLSDGNALGVGSWSGHTIAASAFAAGVASATPTYTFTSKETAAQSLLLRATNGSSGSGLVSSQNYTEPSVALRSGRLRLSSAFGKSTSALQIPVLTEYWSANAWVLNSADSCTTLPAASVALSNGRNALGNVSAATSTASAVTIASGQGSLSLSAPSPAGSAVGWDLAVNLGSTAADQSCQGSHPATTGAAVPWLRSRNGSCAATWDRDPAARASFGIYSPETRKTVHIREMY